MRELIPVLTGTESKAYKHGIVKGLGARKSLGIAGRDQECN